MAFSESQSNHDDRILLAGLEKILRGLSAEELSSLRRVLSMGTRIAPVRSENSEAINTMKQNLGQDAGDSVEQLATLMFEYLDRAILRVEVGLRTWMGVQVSQQLREHALDGNARGGVS